MQGLHLTADLHGCKCADTAFLDADTLSRLCRDAVTEAGLQRVDERFYTFPDYHGQPGGVTGAVLLAESHLAVHTWPERRGVTLDVYVCNFSTDNSSKAEHLMDALVAAFDPDESHVNRLLRGSTEPETGAEELLIEWLNADSAFGYKASRRLEALRTDYQTLEVFETPQFGKLFRLDGLYMTSEKDEFFYHEAIVHPAALAHPAPRTALVIGGGDGGSSEELLKHPTMSRVVMAELDPEVVRIARKYLHRVHRGVFDDPRLEVRIGDGWEFVANTAERFDMVILDLTDPDTPAHRLYTPEFFELLRTVLQPGGVVSLHIGSPVFKPELVARLVTDLRSVFALVRPLGLYIPLYGTYWGLACASDSLDPLSLCATDAARRLAERNIADLRYYNGDVHTALFALPNYFRDLIA